MLVTTVRLDISAELLLQLLEKMIRLTIFTVPSHELDMNVSFVIGFHATENVSRLCSWKFMTGKSLTPKSNSLSEPSPHAAINWFSLISDQARSYRQSFVSNLDD